MSFTRAARSLQRYRPQALRWLAGLAACAGVSTLYLSGSLLFIDRQLASARFQLVTSDPTDEVVVVAIDAPSLQEISVWPWPRGTHAAVIDKLREAGARKIAVDIDFSATSNPEEDAKLAAALARAGGNVILPVFEQSANSRRTITSTARCRSFVSIPASHPPTSIRTATASCGDWRASSCLRQSPVPTMAAAAAELQPTAMGRYYVDFGIDGDQI